MTSLEDKPWVANYPPGVGQTLAYPDKPIYEVLNNLSTRMGRKIGLVYENTELTWGFMDALVNQTARALLSLGFARGQRIAVVLPSSPQIIFTLMGASRVGCSVLIADPLNPREALSKALVNFRPKGLVVSSDIISGKDLYEPLSEIIDSGAFEVVLTASLLDFLPPAAQWFPLTLKQVKSKRRAKRQSWFRLVTKQSQRPPDAQPQAMGDVMVNMVRLSAPGEIDLVPFTQVNLIASAQQLQSWFHIGEEDSLASSVSMNTAAGLVTSLFLPVQSAATFAIYPLFEPTQMISSIQRHKFDVLSAPPHTLRALALHLMSVHSEGSALKLVLSMGPRSKDGLETSLSTLTGAKVCHCYAAAEVGAITHCTTPDSPPSAEGAVGLPLPDTEVKLIGSEAEGKEALSSRSSTGLLAVRGAQVPVNPPASKKGTSPPHMEGWMMSEDFVRIDSSGAFTIEPGSSGGAYIAGARVNLEQLETLLRRHSWVRDAEVAITYDPLMGERPIVRIMLKDSSSEPSPKEFTDYVGAYLMPQAVPIGFEFIRSA